MRQSLIDHLAANVKLRWAGTPDKDELWPMYPDEAAQTVDALAEWLRQNFNIDQTSSWDAVCHPCSMADLADLLEEEA